MFIFASLDFNQSNQYRWADCKSNNQWSIFTLEQSHLFFF